MSRATQVSANPNVADPNSAAIVLTEDQPFPNHNGGQISFGPDGFLYLALGDGGHAGDPNNYGQRLDTILGKVLRIDVNSGSPYAIPPNNPFVNTPGARGEIWSYGLRNQWRFSFDRETGDLFIADVGQNLWEEVNFQLATSPGGENYGWRRMEGLHLSPFGWTDPTLTPGSTFVKAVHVSEMRLALNEAYAAAGEIAPTYTDSVLAPGQVVKVVHVSELRTAVSVLE